MGAMLDALDEIEKHKEKVRKRDSYKIFQELDALLGKNPSKKELMEHLWKLLDRKGAWHTDTLSKYARESMEVFLADSNSASA